MNQHKGPEGYWQSEGRDLGPVCAQCGRPLRPRQSVCPTCGYGLDTANTRTNIMTPFGHGLCAGIGAFMFGTALRFSLAGAAPRLWLALGPLVLSALAAYGAAELGKRLLPAWRPAYEYLLVSGMISGPCALLAALAGLSSLEGLLSVWGIVFLGTYLLLLRFVAPGAIK